MFHVEHIAKNPLFYIFLHNFVVKSLLYCSTWNNTIHINVLSTVFAYYLACSTWNNREITENKQCVPML